MIEGLAGGRARLGHTVERQVVGAGGEINVVRIRLPLDREAEEIHVEALHRLQVPRVQREMPETRVCRPIHFPIRIVNGKLTPCPASRSPSRAVRSAARRTSPSPRARRSTVATAGTRRSPSRKSSPAN